MHDHEGFIELIGTTQVGSYFSPLLDYVLIFAPLVCPLSPFIPPVIRKDSCIKTTRESGQSGRR
jgi:hypothetical protein